MLTIVDRFEGEYAVCEQSEEEQEPRFLKIPRVLLPGGVQEGDCLTQDPDGSWSVDRAQTLARRKDIRRRLMNLYGASQ